MTIIEAINRTDELKPNTYPKEQKIAWLSKLDWMIKRFIIDTHEGAEKCAFDGYTSKTKDKTELLAPAPFDEMYQRWLEAQIDLANGEYDRYNVAILQFNTEYEQYELYYNRMHQPAGAGRFVF